MYPVYSTIGLILIVAIAGFIAEQRKKSRTKREAEKMASPAIEEESNNAITFVNTLETLGYFRYAAPTDIDLLRKTMIEAYNPANELTTVWEDDILATPKDYRYYFCDNEDLYEEGGFTDMLKTLQPTFDKIGLMIKIDSHYEVWDQAKSWLNHSISLNGTNYIIFKNFPEAGWGEAAQRLAEILNSELEKQQKDERIYLVSGGNDGRLIFLTREQFAFIDSVYTNKYWKPLTVENWCRTFKVAPMPQ